VSTSSGRSFLFVAVLLGVAAAVAGYYGLTSFATQAAARNNTHFGNVVVTATDLTYGIKLDRAMLRTVRYPKESVPAGAFSTVDSVVGQTTKVFMGAREPVTAIKLSSRGGGLSMLVRPSMRAASLEVNSVSGVSGFVLPGDRVDVLCTLDSRQSMDDAVTRTVLQNVEVLAAGQKTEQQDNKPITVQAVTLLVDPQGAETLALSLHEGKVHLVLRNPDDQAEVSVASLSTRQILGQAPVAQRAPSPPRRVATSPAPPRTEVAAVRPSDKPKVRIIRNANVSETPAVADTSAN
jgi:pilus assembly protein CpaB